MFFSIRLYDFRTFGANECAAFQVRTTCDSSERVRLEQIVKVFPKGRFVTSMPGVIVGYNKSHFEFNSAGIKLKIGPVRLYRAVRS